LQLQAGYQTRLSNSIPLLNNNAVGNSGLFINKRQFEDYERMAARRACGNLFYISAIEHSGRRYIFSRPFELSVETENDLYVLGNKKLNIISCGRELGDALKSLGEDFDFMWNEYAMEKDDRLDSNAKVLKHELLGLVKEIKKIR